jgi:hypothetical protein
MLRMSKIVLPAILLFLVSTAQAEETGTVVQSYNCNFTDGSGMRELSSAIDYYLEQAANIDSEDFQQSFDAVLTPMVSNSSADFYWLTGSNNLNTFARNTVALNGSDAGQAALARFETMSSCKSNLFFSSPVYIGTPPSKGDNEGVLEGYSCSLKAGKNMANVAAFEAAISAHAKGLGAKYNIYRWSPWLANVPADVVYLVAHDDLIAFGSENTNSFTSPSWAAVSEQIDDTMDCKGALYSINLIRVPPENE